MWQFLFIFSCGCFVSCAFYICSVFTPSPPRQVKEICTRGPKMVAAKRSDTIEACVKKMIAADVRHLPVIDDDTGEVFGLISVKASCWFYIPTTCTQFGFRFECC